MDKGACISPRSHEHAYDQPSSEYSPGRPIALITGSGTGIGLELAMKLAAKGYKVYASMRRPAKAHELEARVAQAKLVFGRDVVLLQLDVDNHDSITAAARTLLEAEGRVDVLINNAAFNVTGILEVVDPEDVRQCLSTNVMGPIFLTQALLPHMKRQRRGIIVNISAVGGVNATPFSEVWCASKFALEGFSESLAQVARQFNIRTMVVEPGPTYHKHVPNLKVDTEGADPETLALLDRFLKSMGARHGTAQTAEEVADMIVQAIEMEDPPFRLQTNPAYQQDISDKLRDPTGSVKIKELSARFFPSEVPGPSP